MQGSVSLPRRDKLPVDVGVRRQTAQRFHRAPLTWSRSVLTSVIFLDLAMVPMFEIPLANIFIM